MRIGVRDLRNQTRRIIQAVKDGERIVLTVHGEPVADIVPHGERTRWLNGDRLRLDLEQRAADPELSSELETLAGRTLEDM